MHQRDRQDTSNDRLSSQDGKQMLRDPGISGGDVQDYYIYRSQEIDSTLILINNREIVK